MSKLKFTREAVLEAPGADERVPVVLSTEFPVEREDFVEVLSHASAEHVDLQRAPLPLLTLHDARKLPVGVVEDLRVDTKRRELRGFARFASGPEGQALLEAVRERVIRSVSIGYILVRELHREGRRRYFSFQPYEASAVAVPADPGAAFYRSYITMENHNPNPEHQDDSHLSRSQRRANERAGNAEAERVKEIVSLGTVYTRYLQPNDVSDACERGTSVEDFKERIMSRMHSRHTDTSQAHVGMTVREVDQYSLARAVSAQLTGDWSKAGLEREASRACERQFGRATEGFFVPHEYWQRGHRRDFNVGTSTEAGNLVATDLRGDLFADVLRNKLVLGLLGVRIISGLTSNVDIPKKTVASSVGMLTEIQAASETNPQTGKVSLTPHRIGGYVEYSKQALIQSSLPLEGMLRDDLLQSSLVTLEDQCINGSGSGANIRGIRNTSGIGSVVAGTNGATVAWQHFLDLEGACANANAMPGALAGYLTNTKVKAKAKGVQRGTNLDFIIPGDQRSDADGGVTVNGYRAYFTNNVPSNLTKGTSTTVCSAAIFSSDWSTMVLGLFGPPDVVVDPYTLAATGQVRITLNQYADFGMRQAAAAAAAADLLTT